jgi:hypothetical protein
VQIKITSGVGLQTEVHNKSSVLDARFRDASGVGIGDGEETL